MCLESPNPGAGEHQQSRGVWGRPGRRQTRREELLTFETCLIGRAGVARGINEHGQLFPASWVKGEGKSSQSLEKGEGF